VGGLALAGSDLGLEGDLELGEPVVGELDSGVAAAALAGGDQERVAAATDRAVQQAFEVVMVLAFADAAGRAGGQPVLDPLEQLGADQGLVLALGLGPGDCLEDTCPGVAWD
jgi:hypothetical protein